MNNKLTQLLSTKQKDILTLYFTAGFPKLESTISILKGLDSTDVDIIEVGIPFTDPVADGPVIQKSNTVALKNGITLPLLFKQLQEVNISKPIVLMGYFNQFLQFGAEQFCTQCKAANVSGLIIPDLPIAYFNTHYKELFDSNNLHNHYLITPQTSDERIREIDNISTSFIYAVADNSITGNTKDFNDAQVAYFKRIAMLKLKSPIQFGFGIYNNATFSKVCQYGHGGIIGSSFIKALEKGNSITDFVKNIRG